MRKIRVGDAPGIQRPKIHWLKAPGENARCKATPGWTAPLEVTTNLGSVTCQRCNAYIAKEAHLRDLTRTLPTGEAGK